MDSDSLNLKKAHFTATYPEQTYPNLRNLSEAECNDIKNKLIHRVKLEPTIDGLSLTKNLFERSTNVVGIYANSDNFSLQSLLSELKILCPASVYVNWRHYDDIDEISFAGLNDYFDDVWYSGPDEIDIFDATFKWLIFVNGSGYISFLKL